MLPLDITDQPVLTPWDLFRYSPESVPLLDLTPGGRPYFSIDGGVTEIAPVTSGQFNGDGFQSAHWTPGHGLMDAALSDFVAIEIQAVDLLALDVIGWDVVVVPEPSTLILAIGILWLISSLRPSAPLRPLRLKKRERKGGFLFKRRGRRGAESRREDRRRCSTGGERLGPRRMLAASLGFRDPISLSMGTSPEALTVADLDGDGLTWIW